ncbi:MAG: hypothetical protein ACF8OB_11420 [Phycisphaeraceae bacterium JB051]
MSTLATWSLLCFLLAVVLFAIEVFVPSGGLLGVLAIISAITGIIFLFQIDTTLGLVGSIVCVAAIPVLIMSAMKFWPSTPFGRMLILKDPKDNDDVDRQQGEVAENIEPDPQPTYLNMTGIAHTDLRPVGICRLDDHKEHCISVSGMIEAGTPIKVVAITDGNIKVQPLDD